MSAATVPLDLDARPALKPLSDRPLVSIIVPSYNHGRYIGKTLDSILAQSYRPLEIIVADGASTDETVPLLKSYAGKHTELRWLSEKDEGVASAVNKGLTMARGEIAGVQSSDDLYYEGAITSAVHALQENPECGLAYGESDAIDTDDRLLSHYYVPEFSWEAVFGISLCLPQQSVFFRMDLARTVGGWNGKYFGCDLDYWLRLMLRAPAVKIQHTLSAWRTYPEQRTQPGQYRRIWEGYWQMIADNTELQRAEPRLRRLAHASCHAMALRYHPTGNLWVLRWHALCAFLLFPGFLHHCPRWVLKPLLPGYLWLRRLKSVLRPPRPAHPGPRVSPGGARPTTY